MAKIVREIVVKIVDTGVNVYLELPERIHQFSNGEQLEYRETLGGRAVIIKHPSKD